MNSGILLVMPVYAQFGRRQDQSAPNVRGGLRKILQGTVTGFRAMGPFR